MANRITHCFPGGTGEQCEAVMIAISSEAGVIPDGQIVHVAGAVAGGWQVMALPESKESRDRFVAERFLPVMGRGIEGGFAAAPTATEFENAHFLR